MTASEAKRLGKARAKARADSVADSVASGGEEEIITGGNRIKVCPVVSTEKKIKTKVQRSISSESHHQEKQISSNDESSPFSSNTSDSSSSSIIPRASSERAVSDEAKDEESRRRPSSSVSESSDGTAEEREVAEGDTTDAPTIGEEIGSNARSESSSPEELSGGGQIASSRRKTENSAKLSTETKRRVGSRGTAKRKQTVTLDRGVTQGKVEVVIGNRPSSRSWRPSVAPLTSNRNEGNGDSGTELLGNINVGAREVEEDEKRRKVSKT